MKWWIVLILVFVVMWYGHVPAQAPDAGAGVVSTGWPDRAPVQEECMPGEVVLDMDDDQPLAAAQAVVAGLDVKLIEPADFMRRHAIYKVVAAGYTREQTIALAAELAKRPGVQHAEPNWLRHALYQPNDPLFKNQWHMRMVRAPETWDIVTGEGIVVAVNDTGIAYGKDPKNPTILRDLKGATLVHPYNSFDDNTDANDRQSHGSHVAGTIAQSTNNGEGVVGVAYKAKLMPVKVLSDAGWGSMESVVKGIYWAADHGANVINMSLGSRQGAQIEEDAVTYAFKKGVFVACAAGNEGRELVNYPAMCKDAVAVAAVRFDKTKSFYTSYGEKVAISAPGGDTRVDQDGDGMPDGVYQNTVTSGGRTDGYFMFQGTSMATPHVAGAAALVMSAGVKCPTKVLEILQATSVKVEGNARGMGRGIIDCLAAVKMAKQVKQAEDLRWFALVAGLFAGAWAMRVRALRMLRRMVS